MKESAAINLVKQTYLMKSEYQRSWVYGTGSEPEHALKQNNHPTQKNQIKSIVVSTQFTRAVAEQEGARGRAGAAQNSSHVPLATGAHAQPRWPPPLCVCACVHTST
ncbi:unnamed protein product [Arctia plantaginis]|uniref:Uncharacterized protein n=1 Tax=Arctia plantaginis TaxID=874455 RepID=A0A8S1A0L0_ARCPL|nr:unnamed protein product [Arctia plantaginis]